MNVCPAIVSVPVRMAPGLAATENFTVPLPVPLPGVTPVIHVSLLVAVHSQPGAEAVIMMGVLMPPAAVNDWDVWSSINEHAACWVTVNVWPATVRVPVRGVPFGLTDTEKFTVPFPVPLPGVTPAIHGALLVAVHAQPGVAVTTMGVPAPPAALMVWDAWSSEYEHAAAAWVTVNVCPAIVRVPVRGVPVGLAATEKFTVPFPVPLPGVTPVIHVALLVAVHAHPGVAVIRMGVPAPPAALMVWDAWSSEYEHAAAAWVTVNVCPAIVRVPVRGVPSGLAATEKFTVPFPVPLPGVTPVIHVALLVAVHAHPGVAVIRMGVPAPPAALNDWDAWSSEYEQPAASWVTVNVWLATVRVPVRETPFGLAATEKFTVPFPVPLPGVTPVIHETLLVAVHAHPGVAVITMGVPAPPAALNDWDVWSSEYEQPAASWVTVNVWPCNGQRAGSWRPGRIGRHGEIHGAVPGAAPRGHAGDPRGVTRGRPRAPWRGGDQDGRARPAGGTD